MYKNKVIMLSGISLLKKKINHAVAWALIEACGYKILYLMLHLVFFKKLSPHMYTLQATLFAVLYMGVTIFNGGFDLSLLYHFNIFAFSKPGLDKLFKNFGYQIGITIVCTAALGLVAYQTQLISHFVPLYKSSLIIILGLLLIIETIKKNLKVFLYLTFYNTHITLAELTGLALYTSLMTYNIFQATYSLNDFFRYLLYINSGIVIFFACCVYHYYRKKNHIANSSPTTYNTKIQYQSYFLQLTKIFLSSQILMPLHALSMQLHESAHFFLIATIIQSGEFILHKICYISGSTFFIYDTSENKFLSNNLFSILLKRLIPFYSLVVLIALTPIFYILPATVTNFYFTVLYGITLLIDNFLSLYEKYAVIHDKISAYSLYSFTLCILAWSMLYTFKTSNIFIAATLFFIGKIILVFFIYSKDKKNNIKYKPEQ